MDGTDCPKCGHPWAEHTTTAGAESEHECKVDVGGDGNSAWWATPCDCPEIPPGHAPDWVWCEPCQGPEPGGTQ